MEKYSALHLCDNRRANGGVKEREGEREVEERRAKKREKMTIPFVLLAVRAVNGQPDRLALALITRGDTDYRPSATRPPQTCNYSKTRTEKKRYAEQVHRLYYNFFNGDRKGLNCFKDVRVSPRMLRCFSTFQLKRRLVCVADSRVKLEGCVSGAACRV